MDEIMDIPSMDGELIERARELASRCDGGLGGEPDRSSFILRGGSDRLFLRLQKDARSVIAMIQPGGGEEFKSYLSIASFLGSEGIGVPEIYGVDSDIGLLVMEDLGDVHLEDELERADSEKERSLYGGCIEILIRFETDVNDAMKRERLIEDRIFGTESLLWETEYFTTQFLVDYCNLAIPSGWEDERRSLAGALLGQPGVFMHRDFQSRNILIKDGELRIVDFQTAHRGPGVYDAASLLKDAYHPLPSGTRNTLLNILYNGLREKNVLRCSFEEYFESFTLAGLQRNMQALAAFAKLGTVKGKSEFLEAIPAGLDMLEEGAELSGRMPVLKDILKDIRLALKEG